jgi:transposase
MLYFAADLHRKQMTINVRDEAGDVLLRRQVSTWGEEPTKFLADLQRRAGSDGWVAILEVCGFHDWLLALLPRYGCRDVVLIQPGQKQTRKTDRRDANQLGELLWINRRRLLTGGKVQGLRRVVPPSDAERDDRRLTQLRFSVTRELTRTINRVKYILRRLNIEQHCPTKGIQTQRARLWLEQLKLPALERLEMDQLLLCWKTFAQQRDRLDHQIAERARLDPRVALLHTTPGASHYSALALACRIGPIERFLTPRSLSNYWGLTPSCATSDKTSRIGSITKEGSSLARYLLGQLVLHVLRRDPAMRSWFRRIKQRRGAKIARVAVMRRLSVIFWHMLRKQHPYPLAARQAVTRGKTHRTATNKSVVGND